jgi:nucleoside-diphosphate-sugar epimerase
VTLNLCAEVGYSLTEILAMMASIAGYEIDVHVNPAFVRANEVHRLVGSRQRLIDTLGDERVIPLAETLAWMYES